MTAASVGFDLVVPAGAAYGDPVQFGAVVQVTGGTFSGGWLQFVDQDTPVGARVRDRAGMVSLPGVTLPAGVHQSRPC